MAAKGEVSKAQQERALLVTAVSKQPADAMYGFNTARSVLALAREVLEARMAVAHRDHKASIRHWRAAVADRDALAYDEPPDWHYPVRESLGTALFRDGQYEEAEKVFRADLDRNPRNGRSLFGLLETLKVEKKTSSGDWVRPQFDQAWRNADTELRMNDL